MRPVKQADAGSGPGGALEGENIVVNKVILVGNMTADPEVRRTPSGHTVANIRFATNEKFKDREGALQERAEFHRIVFFGRDAETIERWGRKGKPLYVEGRIQTKEYEDRDGNRRWSTEIVAREFKFLGGGRSDGDRVPAPASASDGGNTGGNAQGGANWGQDAPSTPATPPATPPAAPPAAENTPGNDAWGGSDDDLPF